MNTYSTIWKTALIHQDQFGFRPDHSCHTALTRSCDGWLSAINSSEIVSTVFLDFKKLLIVWITLFYLRRSHSTSKTLCLSLQFFFFFFHSYLTNRTQYVFLNNESSSGGLVRYGVPQGCVLGPLLFRIFINDLPLHISNDKASNDLFADDSSLNTRGKKIQLVETSLQGSLNEVTDWCGSNSMIIHPAKTKRMVIATRRKHQLSPFQLKRSL